MLLEYSFLDAKDQCYTFCVKQAEPSDQMRYSYWHQR